MKRIFSGAKTPEFPAPPRFFSGGNSPGSSSPKNTGRSRSSSLSKIFSGSNSPKSPVLLPQESSTTGHLSPELVPIVTLISAQTHRRYHEGTFLILQDLKNDGSPASRKWQQVYGVLIGTQLALWDAKELAGNNPDLENTNLKEIASKPYYINFTDASLRTINGSDAVFTESKKKLENALVVSTTLKNRYFLQFANKESFNHWNAAIRLSLFELTSLQEAYTGAFLSSRGAKLGDIKIILSNSKFDYEDWVSVRFGTGMPWKRCFAVISQSTSKKHPFGKVKFYENNKKNKKTSAMATIVSSKALYAVYPSSPLLIDTSTIIKLEGEITFDKKDSPQETNIFIMPEKHHAVPGYDTIIRFLIPAMNAFRLYGRPEKLIANKVDQNSLLFALPTLPHIHYLKVDDLLALANSLSCLQWSTHDWKGHIKDILTKKIGHNYTGCGSSASLSVALSSPVIGAAELFETPNSISSPSFLPKQRPTNGSTLTFSSTNTGSHSTLSGSPLHKQTFTLSPASTNADKQSNDQRTYQTSPTERLMSSPTKKAVEQQGLLKVNIKESNYDRLAVDTMRGNKINYIDKYSNASELSALYDKYSAAPFGRSPVSETTPVSQTINVNDSNPTASPYAQYVGSSDARTFEISNIRDSTSTSHSNEIPGDADNDALNDDIDPLQEFSDLAKTISEIGLESVSSISKYNKANDYTLDEDLKFNSSPADIANEEDNVFDPDYTEHNHMLETESILDASEASSVYTTKNDGRSRSDYYSTPQTSAVQQSGVTSSANRLPHSVAMSDMTRMNQSIPLSKQRERPVQSSYTNNYNQPNLTQNVNQYSSRNAMANPVQKLSRPSPSNSPQYQQFPQSYNQSPSRPFHAQQNHYQAPPFKQYSPKQNPAPQPQYEPFQMYSPQHSQLPQQTHQMQYAQKQPYPQSGVPQNRFPDGNQPGPQVRQPLPHGAIQSGPYGAAPKKPVSTNKPRPPPNAGFSQFMPSANVNPYSR
ncbi:hypothetical protein HG535_0A00830 [Zygotorulaspora mrakii]|uniref:PH domain-containing protein n=1 Tax=Zygotorulaspora mrakii TaxID=42260 RepID=A0A7H9AVR9_ZYGMR|nr:uncharacterized protein HG535_0A00830 [Zygotorulaspora mrakii]QLG70144.1 hypothetical protein HG535_0A00830 [Zygotorulaspora mrakii]